MFTNAILSAGNTSQSASGTIAGKFLRLLFFMLLFLSAGSVGAQAINDYRSNVVNGIWHEPSTWQRFDGSTWVAVGTYPNLTAGTITILPGHTIRITDTVTVDQLVIQTGAEVRSEGLLLTVNNGPGNDISNSGTLTSDGNVTLATGASINGMLFFNGNILTNNGQLNGVILSGSATQYINGNNDGIIASLQVQNAENVVLGANLQISYALFLISGNIITGANKLSLWAGANAQTGGNYFVNGNLEMAFAPGNNIVDFLVGDASGSHPIQFQVNNITSPGSLQVSTVAGDHPNIASSALNPSRSVNRGWRIVSTDLVYGSASATFSYNAADFDPGVNNNALLVGVYSPSTGWRYPAVSSRTATSLTVAEINLYNPFVNNIQLAEPSCPPVQINCAPDFTVCANGPAGYTGMQFSPQVIPAVNNIELSTRNVNYQNVSLNGGGNSLTVLPGAPVSLSYNLSVSYDPNTVYCPGCVVQSSIGLGGTFQTLNCEQVITNGFTSNPNVNFIAPGTPGIYYLTQEGSLDFTCQEFFYNNDPARAIAVLIVGPPFPTATGGCIGARISNNAPALLPVGTTAVTWTATDSLGNTSTCVQNITVTAATVYYRDRDGDGFGSPVYQVYACTQPAGFITEHTDCDDYNPTIQSGCAVTCNLAVRPVLGDTSVICNESQLQFASVSFLISGANGPVTVTGDTTNLSTGRYFFTFTDALGCSVNDTVDVIRANCIVPYYAPPANDTVNAIIGAELTQISASPGSVVDTTATTSIFRIDAANNQILVQIIVQDGQYASTRALLETSHGLNNIIEPEVQGLIITGYIPISELSYLNTIPEKIRYVRPYFTPVTSGTTGLANTQGDKAMMSDIARKAWKLSGKGIRIGVMSDSYNTLPFNPALRDVEQGDLPGPSNPVNKQPVVVMEEYPYGRATDEGRAMLQIVHDVAPEADLVFRTGFVSPEHFADGIRKMRDAGCNIIVDDITYLTEPFFFDGAVAKAVDDVTATGVSYFTSAGNFGVKSYEGNFEPTDAQGYADKAHNFGNGQYFQDLTLGAGSYTIALQWDDNFYSLGAPMGAQNDLDIYLVDQFGTKLFGFNRVNTGGDPIEILPFVVVAPVNAKLIVTRKTGTGNVRFKYVIFRGDAVI
ncbi:MAG: hypothetical protein EOO05_16190, partial [Chitinophagaceae bacterium]